MMMKSVFWWRKPEYPEETTNLGQVTDETFHTYGLCPVQGFNLGRSTPPRYQITRYTGESVQEHVNSFPAMEPHYARSKYKEKKFLEKDLNIKQMYVLYCEKHASNPEMLMKEKYYRNVLHTDFPDLGFHKPKKDACNFCFSFGNMTDGC